MNLKEQFDYVLIDSPAGIERGFRNSIIAADSALVITTPEVSAVRDADRVIGLLEANNKRDPQLIINRLKPELVREGDMLDVDDVLQILAIELLGVVPEDSNMIRYTNRGEPAILDNISLSGRAFNNIAARLDGEDRPFMSLEIKENFFQRIGRIFTRA